MRPTQKPADTIVLLDVGGVLAHADMADVANKFGLDGVTAEQMLTAFAEAQQAIESVPTMDDWNRACWRGAVERLGGDPDSPTVINWINRFEAEDPNPFDTMVALTGVVEAMHRLEKTGVRIAIVSNAHPGLETKLEQLGICTTKSNTAIPNVGAIIASREVGMEKPSIGIFRLALQALGVKQGDLVIMVGDSNTADMQPMLALSTDVEIANSVGFVRTWGVHVDRTGTCTEGSHAEVMSMPEATDLIIANLQPELNAQL